VTARDGGNADIVRNRYLPTAFMIFFTAKARRKIQPSLPEKAKILIKNLAALR
jgi:hypothetical protein